MFGRKPEGKSSIKPPKHDDPEAAHARRRGWHLPDMEAGHPEDMERPEERVRRQRFHYEEGKTPPAGEHRAELVAWHPLDSHRIVWRFQLVAEEGTGEPAGAALEIRSGVVCREGNHLHQILRALAGRECAPLALDAAPASRDAARDAVNAVDPDTLLHRRCRLQVEHVRDDLGDTHARITAILPATP